MNRFWVITILTLSINASLGCKKPNEAFVLNKSIKFNGINLTATKQQLEQKNINLNTITLMPFGFLQNLNAPNIQFNEKLQLRAKIPVEALLKQLYAN